MREDRALLFGHRHRRAVEVIERSRQRLALKMAVHQAEL
jgi:hypothetical protein